MKNFVQKGEISLIHGEGVNNQNGYLVRTSDGESFTNAEFVKAQLLAHRIIVTAKIAEGKDFEGKEAESLAKLRADVDAELSKKNIEYVPYVKLSKGSLNEQLLVEALAFNNGMQENYTNGRINSFMSQFDAIHDFEAHGMLMEVGTVKLPAIYTKAEITEAVKSYSKLFNI